MRKKRSPFQILAVGFALFILTGTFLLMLPLSTVTGVTTPFLDALFTATTAVSVTGLVVYDTGTYWSGFGHAIILFLIQIGGLGVVTVAAALSLLTGKKIGLLQRMTLREEMAAREFRGIIPLLSMVFGITFLAEAIGACVLAITWIPEYGWSQGIWMSIFHAVSAFCNAGIDMTGSYGAYSSLTMYATNPFVNIAIISLIIAGGMGFMTWSDVAIYGSRFRKYSIQSKVIFLFTVVLIVVPAIIFYYLEFMHVPADERAWVSVFQAVTARTAGFNTANTTNMSEAGRGIMICLMFIGGAPGSTASGIKTTTFAVLLACAWSVFRKRASTELFNRRIPEETIRLAISVAFFYLVLCLGSAVMISYIESLPFSITLYESVSAVANVGLSLGITPHLGSVSKVMLILLMYTGRVGGLTLIYAATASSEADVGRLPTEKITVG